MKIAICGFQNLFVRGGAALLWENLQRELGNAGHQAELVNFPFTWSKPDLLDNIFAWRLIHVEADIAFGTVFHSFFFRIPNKVVWLVHQHRPLYELFGSAYSTYGHEPEDEAIQRLVKDADGRVLREAKLLFAISENVARRLRESNGVSARPLYHPPPLHDFPD